MDPAAWDGLARTFPDYTVFHSLAWLETVSATHGVKIVLARADVDGRCVAVWPYLEMRKGPLRVIGSPLPGWSTAYLGPLFAHGADTQGVLESFLSHKLFRRYAYFACKVIDRSGAIDLAPHGFSVVMKFDTYRIDLRQTEQALWDNLKSECRTRIRKAQKLGIEIKREQDGGFVDDFWAMAIETFQKSKIEPTHNKQFVRELWTHLSQKSAVYALSAWVEGERAGILVLPYDERTMYYWGGASFLRFREIPAHNLLHWQAICDARQMGLAEYDFISTIGGPGRFKKTFGPQTIDMSTHWERSPSRLMAALKKRYQQYLLKRRRVEA